MDSIAAATLAESATSRALLPLNVSAPPANSPVEIIVVSVETVAVELTAAARKLDVPGGPIASKAMNRKRRMDGIDYERERLVCYGMGLGTTSDGVVRRTRQRGGESARGRRGAVRVKNTQYGNMRRH